MDEQEKFEGWAVLELMGHRRLGGYVREATVAGAGMLRIDIPSDKPPTLIVRYPAKWAQDGSDYMRMKDDAQAEAESKRSDGTAAFVLIPSDQKQATREWMDHGITQFVSPSSVYAFTPVTEAMARAVAKHNIPEPVHRWELPQLPEPETPLSTGEYDANDDL